MLNKIGLGRIGLALLLAIVCSGCPQPVIKVTIPNVVGLTQVAAATNIANAGLILGTVTLEFNNSVPAGIVITQNPIAATSVDPGTSVDLVVSKGIEPCSTVSSFQYPFKNESGWTRSQYHGKCNSDTINSNRFFHLGEDLNHPDDANNKPIYPIAEGEVFAIYQVEPSNASDTNHGMGNVIIIRHTLDSGKHYESLYAHLGSINVTIGQCVGKNTQIGIVGKTGGQPSEHLHLEIRKENTKIWGLLISVDGTIGYGASVEPRPAGTIDPAAFIFSNGENELASELSIGKTVTVQSSQGQNVRTSFDVDSQSLGLVTDGVTGIVVDGPECGDNYTWWKVDWDNSTPTGWIAEFITDYVLIATDSSTVTVPSVVGQSQSSAQNEISGAGLNNGTVTQAFSCSVANGSVISQNPTAGTTVSIGSTVTLVVSKGSGSINAPNLGGMTQANATTTITNAGLTVGTITNQASSIVPAGSVISQNPTAGTPINVCSSTNVSIVISSGPATVSVPNVVNAALVNAQNAITAVGLVVGDITEEYSPTVPAGNVISQDPLPGTLVDSGSAINLLVSKVFSKTITISNITDLQKIGQDINYPMSDVVYRLGGNINAAASSTWNGGLGFTPIGSSTDQFGGVFDGRGFKISGLTINRPTQDYVGLFASIGAGALIFNMDLEDARITGRNYTSVLVGMLVSSEINDCNILSSTAIGVDYVGTIAGFNNGGLIRLLAVTDGTLNGQDYVGGAIGKSTGGGVSDISFGGLVVGSSSYIGGLIGSNITSLTNATANAVSVNGSDDVGGLIGYNEANVSDVASSGNVVATSSYAGGLIGYHESGSISGADSACVVDGAYYGTGGLIGKIVNGVLSDSFATGACTSDGDIGGLLGVIDYSATITRCYATGEVISTGSDVGGLIGAVYSNSTITECYALGDITANGSDVGGLIGDTSYDPVISKSFATGNVVAQNDNVGGLLGHNSAVVSNCFAQGSVNGRNQVGGLLGENYGSASRCYSVGAVQGTGNVGGLIGYKSTSAIATNSFWDMQTSGMTASAGGSGKNTSTMLQSANYTSATWDFIDTWGMQDGVGYPYLQWYGAP